MAVYYVPNPFDAANARELSPEEIAALLEELEAAA